MQHQFDPEVVAQFEHATWSRCAQGYREGFGPLVSEAIEPLLDSVEANAVCRLLDIGTGPGLVAAAAKERGAAPVGIDFSQAMLDEARRLHADIEFRSGSADALPFDDESFDAVVGNFVFHHLGRPDAVLKETFRVLRDGGRMGFTVWADLAKLEAFGLFFAAVEEHAGTAELPHGPLFGVSDFEVFHQMTRAAGFHESSVMELPLEWCMGSIDSFLAAFHDWAGMDAFPDETRDAIEKTVRERAASYRSEKGITIPNPAILVSAVK